MYKTVSEVLAALNQEPDPSIVYQTYDGKNYIAWDDAVAELDRIFGPFSWSTEAISYSGYPEQGVYLAALNLSVTVLDDDTGETYSVTRAGFGRGVAQPTKEEFERGIYVSPSLITHDTAASAAGSDALSKATKLVGKALGQKFYGEARRARRNGNGSAPSGTRPPVTGTVTGEGATLADGKTLSPKQVSFLGNLGWSSQDIAGMTLPRAKSIMENREKATADALPF